MSDSKGEKVTAKAHGGPIDIQGVTVATVDEKVRLQRVETWFDPMEMFRQIAPKGVVNKEIGSEKEKAGDEEDEESKPSTKETQVSQQHPHNMEEIVKPAPGEAVVAPIGSEEVKLTQEEMSNITPAEFPDLMNKE